jgi:hypothetical protein
VTADRNVEKLLDELDQQEMHLRRLGRRIDQLQGQLGKTEVVVGRRLQDELEHASDPAVWGEPGPPPGWPDVTSIFLTRSRVQRRLILELAGDAEALGANRLRDAITEDLEQALARLPFAMDAHFHNPEPVVVLPDALSRDFLELVLNAQQEALLKIDLALERLI